ncbi:periplasmic heavy metal sensor [Nevskia ramosa]|uniref:periplasmic heavy metal sensor n=1 Tax=Nevskia ramosa TaxID=64002 RepID=UPI0003B4785E|nr:periplasmic heavy metal sensor [Nevskia ramosa]
MTSAMNGDPPRKRNNWLIASVALNLFLLGGIAGAVLLGPPRGPFGERGFPPEGFGPARMLSPAGREQLHKLHQEDRETLRPQLEALHSARMAMTSAFGSEPFDRAAFDVAQKQMETAEQGLATAMGQRVIRLAETLSADDRKAFAKAMGRLPMGPPGMAGGGPPGIGGGEFRLRGPMSPDAPDMPPPPRD